MIRGLYKKNTTTTNSTHYKSNNNNKATFSNHVPIGSQIKEDTHIKILYKEGIQDKFIEWGRQYIYIVIVIDSMLFSFTCPVPFLLYVQHRNRTVRVS